MFCVKCGNEIHDENRFCPKCGTEVRMLKAEGAAEPNGPGNAPVSAKPKSKKKIFMIVAACLVVIAAVGAGAWWHFSHAGHLITVQVDAPGLDEDSTPVPVEISGTDASGSTVHEWAFVRPGDMDVQLMPGAYDFTFSAGYVTSDAHVAVPSETSLHIDVELFDDEQKQLDETVKYKMLEDDEVSDEQFALITECAEQNPDDDGEAEQLCKKAKEHGDFMAEAKTNAEGFLMSVFDTKNNAAKGRSVSQFVTKGKYVQSGSGATTVKKLTLTMESDSKVSYDLQYVSAGPGGSLESSAKGYVGIASDGKVDSWYGEGSKRNSLYG